MKLLLFDVDGTLITTGGAGVRALERAFRRLWNLENAMTGISPAGKTDPGIVREVLTGCIATNLWGETALADILEAYVAYLREEIDNTGSYRIMPGVVEMLNELQDRPDVLIGLATGNIEVGARIKLERGKLNRYFSFGGFGSDSESRAALVRHAAAQAPCAPAILNPADIFVIGDTPRDIQAGRDNGFTTIGVATGMYTAEELRAAGAAIVMSDFHQDRDHFLASTLMA